MLALLREHRYQMDDLVTALLSHETLDMADAYAAIGQTPPPRAEQQAAALADGVI